MLDRIYKTSDKRLWGKTGEVRCPKTGEHWLDPLGCVCYAAVDFTTEYQIVREVEIDMPATYKFKNR